MANVSGRWQQAGAPKDTWESADPQLLENEIGIESDTGKFKFGKLITDSETKEERLAHWSELDYAGTSVEDIQSLINEAEDNVYIVEVTDGSTDTEAITAALTRDTDPVKTDKGNMVIVRRLIVDAEADADKKWSYTSYVSDGANWRAMDGNYSASNIYFSEDLLLTQQFGKYTVPTSGSYTINTATDKMSLQDLFLNAFSEEKQPTVTAPSISSLSVSATNQSAEVGSTYGLPKATLSLSTGSYNYGSVDENGSDYTSSTATGVAFNSLKITNDKTSDTATATSGTSLTLNLTEANVATADRIVLDDAITYKFSAEAIYPPTDRYPATNQKKLADSSTWTSKGMDMENDKTLTKTSTLTIKGYRKPFWGTKLAAAALADPTKITSAEVRALGNPGANTTNKWGTAADKVPTQITAPVGTKQVFIAVQAGKKSALSITDANALGAPVACTKVASGVQVADVRGNDENGSPINPTAYDLWYVNLDGSFGKEGDLQLSWT